MSINCQCKDLEALRDHRRMAKKWLSLLDVKVKAFVDIRVFVSLPAGNSYESEDFKNC